VSAYRESILEELEERVEAMESVIAKRKAELSELERLHLENRSERKLSRALVMITMALCAVLAFMTYVHVNVRERVEQAQGDLAVCEDSRAEVDLALRRAVGE